MTLHIPIDERWTLKSDEIQFIIWDNQILDQDFYTRDYLKRSVRQLIPDLSH